MKKAVKKGKERERKGGREREVKQFGDEDRHQPCPLWELRWPLAIVSLYEA
jgi:hypothetical protein